MNVLLDTNILLRLADTGNPHHLDALSAVKKLDAMGIVCTIVPQVLYEYWVVVTRPSENNGLGLSTEIAEAGVAKWISTFQFLRDERGVYGHWLKLVGTHDVKGKNAHDARLVAAMQRHGINDLLTFNQSDFARFTGIRTWTPPMILAGRLTN